MHSLTNRLFRRPRPPAWLRGIALLRFGDYSWMWYADMALALAAAFVNLPIGEAKLDRVPAPA